MNLNDSATFKKQIYFSLCDLTGCCNNSSHREAVTDALRHRDHIRNDIMTFKTPEMTSSSAKTSLDLSGAEHYSESSFVYSNALCSHNETLREYYKVLLCGDVR